MKGEKSKNPGRIRYLYNNVCFDFSHQREDFTVSEAQNRLWISDKGRIGAALALAKAPYHWT